MTAPAWATCPRCQRRLYPRPARRTPDGWACGTGDIACPRTAARLQREAERAEDADWMARHGETLAGAADRLGLTVEGLKSWGRRCAPEVIARLQANEQRRWVA